MRVFITGATGFIGSAIVQELLAAGHQVLGLARSDAAAASLAAAGAQVHRGDLQDVATLRRGAAASDGVIHLGFIHDFANFAAVCDTDRRAVEALGDELGGSDRPLLVASGVAVPIHAGVVTEADRPAYEPGAMPRVATERAVDALAERGVRVGVLRFAPTVHGDGDHGFVPMLIDLARTRGVSAYVGDGANRWPAVHRLDAAHLGRLALEHAFAPGTRFHAVAEEGVPFRAIAEVIARRLGVPAVAKAPAAAAEHFGWFAPFAALDRPASSQRTRDLLGWRPIQPDLLADLDRPAYFRGNVDAR